MHHRRQGQEVPAVRHSRQTRRFQPELQQLAMLWHSVQHLCLLQKLIQREYHELRTTVRNQGGPDGSTTDPLDASPSRRASTSRQSATTSAAGCWKNLPSRSAAIADTRLLPRIVCDSLSVRSNLGSRLRKCRDSYNWKMAAVAAKRDCWRNIS
jgi:hypothetical protein